MQRWLTIQTLKMLMCSSAQGDLGEGLQVRRQQFKKSLKKTKQKLKDNERTPRNRSLDLRASSIIMTLKAAVSLATPKTIRYPCALLSIRFGANRFPNQNVRSCSNVWILVLQYTLDIGEFVHKTVGRNNALSKTLVIANYILAVLGIYFVGVAVWAILQQKNGGVLSYTSRQGFIIRSPVFFGVCFLVCAGGCILSGYFVGVRHVAPSIVEGLQQDERRRALLWYQILSAGTVIIIALVFLAALPPLHRANSAGISTTDWQDMSVSHPDRICSYEVANKCAGAKNRTCSGSKRAIDKGCPGHYCTDTCKVTSSRPETNITFCTECLTSFASSSDLTKCKASESRVESSGTCIARLRRDVQVFLTVIVASSGVGMGILLIAVLLGILSPIINARI